MSLDLLKLGAIKIVDKSSLGVIKTSILIGINIYVYIFMQLYIVNLLFEFPAARWLLKC